MTADILSAAEEDLEAAFHYYESERGGLGDELLDEFRGGLEQILLFPRAWQALDETYRQYRLHRFPYGIVYRASETTQKILVIAVMHLSRKPGLWRRRDT